MATMSRLLHLIVHAQVILLAEGFVLPQPSNKRRPPFKLHLSLDPRTKPAHEVASVTLENEATSPSQSEVTTKKKSELEELQIGYQQVITLEAFDPTHANRLLTPEDFVGIIIHIPLLQQAFQTAFTGQVDATAYAQCALFTFLTSLAHFKMCWDEPRDYRAPRLAEPHSVYEFSALYLIPFSWLLYRMTPIYPQVLEGPLDIVGCIALSIITIYGWGFAILGKDLLKRVNEPNSGYQGTLQPSSEEYQTQAQLYLTGNIIINILACLFLPFAWTLAIRGTEWWTRVQELHPSQGAFLGVSILVAILGDTSGNLLLRLQQLQITTSVRALVVMGILSNFAFLLAPEIVFNVIYMGGVSEVGFYWE